ncbi:1-acyl-sn-glycerol-3-phosphate acyltransferase [Vallitalea longa]|uniref:1-acyl-sn-glycerol-3-phosphate acyltransferase n=1 Tax=Vallitalea longa TaxID=2936439 RepID=A0A9W5Y7H4_9FIRM|nr:lysophospholipid acyltransferase family protein [Vallitalea longa]GKX28255.1 1-acyl-sn-glycerol-3-phosphate acyltransferase [Vallitalea longa]
MIRTIYWFIAFWLYQLFSLIAKLRYWFYGKRGNEEKQQKVLCKTTTKWAKLMIRLTGSKISVAGVENIPDRNVLFVSNHQGNFDIPILMGYVPKLKGFVAKVELENLPIVSGWMKKLGCLFLDRQNPRQSLKVILKGISYLKEGNTLVIFPEGTRSKSSTIGEFKKGSLKLATKSGVPIVPVTINGSYKILEEKKRIRKSNVNITVHPPIYMDDMTKEDENKLIDRVYEIIKSGLDN